LCWFDSQLHQVAIAVLIHCQQDEAEVVARLFRLAVELQCAAHGPVVSDRHGVHAVFFGFLNQVIDADRTIEHGILGVDVQVGEGLRHEKLCGDNIEMRAMFRADCAEIPQINGQNLLNVKPFRQSDYSSFVLNGY
jgi:hypothetical protein